MVNAVSSETTSSDSSSSVDGIVPNEEFAIKRSIHSAIDNPKISCLLFAKLRQLNLDGYEKELGSGGYGTVFQIKGKEKFAGKKLALKVGYVGGSLINGLQRDAIALNFPKKKNLLRAYGIFTYDGKQVHFIKNYVSERDKSHEVIGILSRAIEGGTLYNRVWQKPMDAKEIQGYGFNLAKAIVFLHGRGYAHEDIKSKNILLKPPKKEKPPYRLKLADFGISLKLDSMRRKSDWKSFAWVLKEMNPTVIQSRLYLDLFYSENRGVLYGSNPYTEQEILRHPFFGRR